MLAGHQARTGRIRFDGADPLSGLKNCNHDRVLVSGGFRFVREGARGRGCLFRHTAEVGEPGACKVESWASAASNNDFFAATSPACVVNMFRPVELSSQFNRARSDEEWTTAATPKIKTNLVPTAIGSWGFAISGTALTISRGNKTPPWRLRFRQPCEYRMLCALT